MRSSKDCSLSQLVDVVVAGLGRPIENMIEIGSYAGEGMSLFLSTGKVGKIWCIDPWDKVANTMMEVYGEGTNLCKYEGKFDSRAAAFPGKVVKIKDFSEDAIKYLIEEDFDLIYIDGNHAYDYVKKDIQYYWPLLTAGGYLSGHDYNFPGVKQAVDEAFGSAVTLLNTSVGRHININWLVRTDT
jgi:hypothetical protein